MTDLSMFDGYTNCCKWHVYADRGGVLYVSECDKEATNIDLRLINHAPALLARVKELEDLVFRLVQHLPVGCAAWSVSLEILEKEWL